MARCFVIFFFARTTEAAQVTLLNPVDSIQKPVCTFIYNHGDRVTLFSQFVKKKSGILFGRITWFFQYTYRRDVFFNLFCIKNSLFMVQYFAEFGWSANVTRRFSRKSSCFIPAIRLTHSDSVRTVWMRHTKWFCVRIKSIDDWVAVCLVEITLMCSCAWIS